MINNSRESPKAYFQWVVIAHVATLVVGVSWAFGGNADWVRTPISIWASLGAVLTAVVLLRPQTRDRVLAGSRAWAIPIVALNALVLTSCLTPGFKPLSFAGNDAFLIPVRISWWIPSSARPETSFRALWLFDGIYFSALNLALAIEKRRLIRLLLAVMAGNAFALSIFGTVQKLVGSTGIYFGAVKSPQDYFFASFVYDNHWGAFAILMVSALIGLVLRYAFGSRGEGFFRGPSFFGVAGAFVVAISVPLSGSRACTLLLGILILVALVQGAKKVARALRFSGASPELAFISMSIAAGLMAWGSWVISGDVVRSRAIKAKDQVSMMWYQGGLGARSVLYHNTLRMAEARPLYGWGMGCFPSVFSLYNTQEPRGDRIPVVYHDAHSDWLQSMSEIGVIGTALIGVAVALPARSIRARRVGSIPYFLLTGCALVAAYAWIEFPFGNVAVVLAWWVFFFSAVQYLRLSNGRDERL